MGYFERLSSSFARLWQNPALLSVVLLWFLLTFLLSVLFEMLRLGILYLVNQDLFYASLNGLPNALSYLNTQTYIFYAVFFLVQGAVFVYVLSFFSAGFFGMLKNLMRDGSTVFPEFFPEAKRHWYAMFRLQLVRFLITAVLIGVLAYGMLQFLGTTPGFLSPQQQGIVMTSVILAILGLAVFSFFTLYAESLIVLDDAEAFPAIKDSSRLAARNAAYTLGTALTAGAIVLLGMAITIGLSTLVEIIFNPAAGGWGLAIAVGLNFLLYIVIFAAGVVAAVFIMSSCYDLTVAPQSRKSADAHRPAHTKHKKA